MTQQDTTIIVGAGIGGLAAAVRLGALGHRVTVMDSAGQVGGKMRTVGSPVGPVDAGPTVLTMKPVFEALFAAAGEALDDHVTLDPEPLLARHWWPDGAQLDLFADQDASAAAIREMSGPQSEQDYRRFAAEARRLFEAFERPMLHNPTPSAVPMALHIMRDPGLIRLMAPLSTLAQRLARSFRDPRLRQLYGRYATYVGGSPYQSPAILSLISHSEAAGVWRVRGGMNKLASALADLARKQGADIRLNTHVNRIEVQGGRVSAVHTGDGRTPCARVVFNGDPRALTTGLLGNAVTAATPGQPLEARSLSANVWTFAEAVDRDPGLVHHNVFFARNPRAEFDPIAAGSQPKDATIYVCAEDRGTGQSPPETERFEMILNAPATPKTHAYPSEIDLCRQQTFPTLAQFGLTFRSSPPDRALTTAADFNRLFPASGGALYGQSPHGMMAAFQRPTARTRVPGLFLVGGGAHPGAGIPMATLSASHVAAAIGPARTSTSTSHPTAMPGGMSTA
ncbi:MAG: 1-hydroxycarotenoid 3,4-desaturase CrtD [Pseudomonadota bacterium]